MVGLTTKPNYAHMDMKTKRNNIFSINVNKEEDCRGVAEIFLHTLQTMPVFHYIALSGDLGAGKTTFMRYVLRLLNFNGRVKSPSYQLLETYNIDFLHYRYIYHFDLYRLSSAGMWLEHGFDDYIKQATHLICIEWAQNAQEYLPKPYLNIDIKILNEAERCFCLYYICE